MALSDVAARNAKPGKKMYKLTDEYGLYLQVNPAGTKRWYFNFVFDGKQSRIAFGGYPLVSLSRAREKRDEARLMILDGVHPKQKRIAEKEAEEDALNTFEKMAWEWSQQMLRRRRWSETHARRVWRDLEKHVLPAIGDQHVGTLKTKDLLAPLRVVEANDRLELASRLKQRITDIMGYAVQCGLIDRNPAKDMAGALMPPRVTHRPALRLERLPELLTKLDYYNGRELTKLAIQFTLLTFSRSSEIRLARWSEFDTERAIWTIPAQRTPIPGVKFSYRGAKMQSEHIVPLSRQTLLILDEIRAIGGDDGLLFPGDHSLIKPMSENTVNNALRTLGYNTATELCGHGFRTMACSALIESGKWSRDAVERQMSHQERNTVRAAYIHKAEHIVERKLMMQWWADYLDAVSREFVVPYEFEGG
ncbi:tyrosine-type recombinase/integrase [Morganella morganii]|uniref:tyrosine-type recombinase/integrase n=1 Tax=Morganella morganii TaxID=582 RepID=UPI003F216CF9